MKKIIRRILKEDRQEQFLNKIIKVIKNDFPLFKNLKDYGFNLSEDELDYVFSGIFGEPVTVKRKYIYNQNGNKIYLETSDGYWFKYGYDNNGNRIYYESYNGIWEKSEYDNNGKEIYRENSNGYWSKWEYDENGKIIYEEDSDGYIMDNR